MNLKFLKNHEPLVTHAVSGESSVILLLYRVLGKQLEHCVQFAEHISGKMWTMGRCQRRTGRTIVDLESITSEQGGGGKADLTVIKIKYKKSFQNM